MASSWWFSCMLVYAQGREILLLPVFDFCLAEAAGANRRVLWDAVHAGSGSLLPCTPRARWGAFFRDGRPAEGRVMALVA